MINFKSNNNPDLAMDLFNTLSVGYELNFLRQKQVDRILNKCSCRQDILNKVIEICGKPNTPQKRYIYAMAYGWSNKEYRKKAIYYIELYLKQELYEDSYIHKFRYIDQSIEDRKNEHIYNMSLMLIELYIKEYQFDIALELTENIIKLIPYCPLAYRKKVEILIKTHKIDDAITFLKSVKKGKYYCKNKNYSTDNWMIETIDELLIDCNNKKESKYIYKPKKLNINYIN